MTSYGPLILSSLSGSAVIAEAANDTSLKFGELLLTGDLVTSGGVFVSGNFVTSGDLSAASYGIYNTNVKFEEHYGSFRMTTENGGLIIANSNSPDEAFIENVAGSYLLIRSDSQLIRLDDETQAREDFRVFGNTIVGNLTAGATEADSIVADSVSGTSVSAINASLGTTTISNSLTVASATHLGSTLGVSGSELIGDSLTVMNDCTVNNTIYADKGITTAGYVIVSGATTLNSVTINSIASFNDDIDQTGGDFNTDGSIGGAVLNLAPTSGAPTGTNGSIYYEASSNLPYYYDATRTKWLSFETITLTFGQDANLTNHYLLWGQGSLGAASNGYVFPYDVVITSITGSLGIPKTFDLETKVSGVVVDTLSYSASVYEYDDAVNVTVPAGSIISQYVNGTSRYYNVTVTVKRTL